MDKSYSYFVSYFWEKDRIHNYDDIVVTVDYEVNNAETIEKLKVWIKEMLDPDLTIIILNFKLLKDSSVDIVLKEIPNAARNVELVVEHSNFKNYPVGTVIGYDFLRHIVTQLNLSVRIEPLIN